MDTGKLKKFARGQRQMLLEQIGIRLDWVLEHDDEYLQAHKADKNRITELVDKQGREAFLEEVAYTWFNRIAAIRFMDVNSYNRVKIVSPAEGETQPQILTEIKQGNIPPWLEASVSEINGLLSGTRPAAQPDREIYKLALLEFCNDQGKIMPFLFEKLHDWAALLLPSDILSSESFIADFQTGMTTEDCASVEVIGWLYQFYISEKKDDVFARLKKNVKISRENIPAATQLFTPNWIVRYMADNSIGRLWMNNNPGSSLRSKMEYYIDDEEALTDFLTVSSPEEIKILDPSCGSGHILVYAFDLLYHIYEEAGYEHSEIPALILKNNLYGLDIDKRAASLASFALMMKAREADRFFFKREALPNITSSKDTEIDLKQLDLRLSPALQTSIEYLKDAKNLGALVPVEPGLSGEIEEIRMSLEASSGQLFVEEEREDLLQALKQVEILQPRYHCVITNPPYMGSKGMNDQLKNYVNKSYKDSKSDLFAVFMERGLELLRKKGYLSMINQQSWMFLSSYEKLRTKIIDEQTIITMAHLGTRAFDSIGGEVVSTTSFIIEKYHRKNYKGGFIRLVDGNNESEKKKMLKEVVDNLAAEK